MDAKHWLFSKTIWFGAAQILFGIVAMVTGWTDSQTATALILTGLGTIGFRINTSTAITTSTQ